MDEEERKLVEEVMADYHELRKKFLGNKADETDSWVLEATERLKKSAAKAQEEWNALSDEEKERRANSPEVLESRLWEDWTDCDPVTDPISRPNKSKSGH